MLRLILLASLSLVPGCSCDALWGRYEVPCARGFDCPDAAMPGEGADMATSSDQDMRDPGTGTDDGPNANLDMSGSDMSMADMAPLPGFDMVGTVDDMIIMTGRDLDIVIVGK